MSVTDIPNNDSSPVPDKEVMHSAEAKPFEDLTKVVMVLHEFFTPCLALAVILGNTICIAILLRQRLSPLSTSHHLVAVMTSEMVHMVALLHLWLNEYKMLVNSYQMSGWCQFMSMIERSSDFLCGWYVLVMVTDRFVAYCFTRLESHWCTPFKAKVLIVCSAILALIIFLNTSMIRGEYDIGPRFICLPLHGYEQANNMLHVVGIFLNFFLVYTMVLVLTLFTVMKHLYQRKVTRRHPVRLTARSVSAMLKTSFEDQSEAQSQFGMFTTFVLCFLALGLPVQGHDLSFAIDHLILDNGEGHLDVLHQILVGRILTYLKYVRMVLNLPVLLFSYGLFRLEVKQVLRKALKCRKKLRCDSEYSQEMSTIVDYLTPIRIDCESES